jgi:hypothetical protein
MNNVWLKSLFGSIAAIACATGAAAQETSTAAPALPETSASSPAWDISASVYTYSVPHGTSYASPVIKADRDWLHLEARYNYEALDTGSVFVGYNLSAGDEWKLTATPMVGGVFGDTTGVAPGYELSLAYQRFHLYTEGEYVFDTRDSSGNFFYMWSELSYSPEDWLRVGLVAQRTRAYQTDVDVQRGLLLGLTFKRVDFTAYFFNIASDDAVFVFSLGFGV